VPPVPLPNRSGSLSSQKSYAGSIHALPSLPPPVPQLHLDKRFLNKRHQQVAKPSQRSSAAAIRAMAHQPPTHNGNTGTQGDHTSSAGTSQHLAPSLGGSSKALPPPPPQSGEGLSPNLTNPQVSPWHSRSLSPLRESGSSLEPSHNRLSLRLSNAVSMQYPETMFSTRRNTTDTGSYGEPEILPSPVHSEPSSPTESHRRHSFSESFSQLSMYPDDDDDNASMIPRTEFSELPRQSFGSRFSSHWMSTVSRDSVSSMVSRATTTMFREPGVNNVPPLPSSNRTSVSGRSDFRKSAGPSNQKE
jgi:hypothetical protein